MISAPQDIFLSSHQSTWTNQMGLVCVMYLPQDYETAGNLTEECHSACNKGEGVIPHQEVEVRMDSGQPPKFNKYQLSLNSP